MNLLTVNELITHLHLLLLPIGLNTSLVPMYISEIAPLNLRGGLGTVNQLAVTIGLLLSQVLGIEQILGTNDGWPVLLGLAICPAILQLLLLPICPESPRYLLITKQCEEEARKGKSSRKLKITYRSFLPNIFYSFTLKCHLSTHTHLINLHL